MYALGGTRFRASLQKLVTNPMFTVFAGLSSCALFALALNVPPAEPMDHWALRIGAISSLVVSVAGLVTALGSQITSYRKLNETQKVLQTQNYLARQKVLDLESEMVALKIAMQHKLDRPSKPEETL